MNMLHPGGSAMYDSDDDDDYELPSLAERVEAALKLDRMRMNKKKNESDSEEEFSNILENVKKTPIAKLRQINCKVLDSDSDEDFSNIYENYLKTPLAKLGQTNHKEDSDSDEEFPNILQNPLSKLKEPSQEEAESDSDKEFSNILTDICKNYTPIVQKKGISCKESESDSDEGFSNFLENIRNGLTPIARMKDMNHSKNEFENDALPNICEKLGNIHVSEHKKTNDILVPPIVCKKDDSSKKAVPSKSSSVKLRNEEEYDILFPIRPDHLSFKDQTEYGKKLYNFFNEKIFSAELPADMPLIWSGALLRSAGLTCCRRKNEVRSCSIKLSAKLLTTFDRLQDTLLHEMCHAAVWVISKSNENHGPLWKIWASRCKQILPFVDCPERCHSYELPYRVWYHCLNCKWKIGRCKQSRKLQRSVCKTCNAPLVMTRTE